MRITYRPSLDGSPANTAICAPFGSAGGAGPHFNWSAETATWSSAAIAGIDAKPATNNVVTKTRRNMLILRIASLCPLKLPHRDAEKKLLSTSRDYFCGIQETADNLRKGCPRCLRGQPLKFGKGAGRRDGSTECPCLP